MIRRRLAGSFLVLILGALGACDMRYTPEPVADRLRVGAVLDELHAAAARADEDAYFALYSPDAIFIGTDATEHWTVDEFRTYAHPVFADGRGWTYTPRDRNVFFSEDGQTAWFDEMLDNEKYGECRGTGVLVRADDGRWLITQYHLTVPVPNDLLPSVVEQIRKAR